MIEDTFHVWAKNFFEYFVVYLVLGALAAGLSLLSTFLFTGVPSTSGAFGVPTFTGPILGLTVLSYIVTALVGAFISAIFLGAVTFFAFYAHRNVRVSLSHAFSAGLARFLSIFGAQILVNVIVLALFSIPLVLVLAGALMVPANFLLLGVGVLFLLVAFPFAIYLIVALSLYAPVIMIEGVGAVESLRRSWTLTRGHRLSIFASGLVIGIIVVIIESAVGGGIALAILVGGAGAIALSLVGAALASAFVGALFAILVVVAYSLIRADHETMQQSAPGYGAPPSAWTQPTPPAGAPPTGPSMPPPGSGPPPPGP